MLLEKPAIPLGPRAFGVPATLNGAIAAAVAPAAPRLRWRANRRARCLNLHDLERIAI